MQYATNEYTISSSEMRNAFLCLKYKKNNLMAI